MRDPRGMVGASPGTTAGTILALWNPGLPAGSSTSSSTAAATSLPSMSQHGGSVHAGGGAGTGAAGGSADAAAAAVAKSGGVGCGSWEHEAALSVYVIHGGREGRCLVVDHMEVVLHPLCLHLTSGLAADLQDYFSLKDVPEGGEAVAAVAGGTSGGGGGDASGALRGSPMKGGAAGAAGGGASSKVSGASRGGWLHRRGVSAELPTPEQPGPLEAAAMGQQQQQSRTVGGAPAAPRITPGLPPPSPDRPGLPPALVPAAMGAATGGSGPQPAGAVHGSTLSALGSSSSSSGVPSAGARARALTADSIAPDVPNRYGPLYRRGRLASRSHGSSSGDGGVLAAVQAVQSGTRHHKRVSSGGLPKAASHRGSNAGGVLVAGAAGAQQGGQRGSTAVRMGSRGPRVSYLYRFKHVRFNRMHARVTYDGPPLSLNDFRLVSDGWC